MHRTEGLNNVLNMFSDGPPGTIIESRWLNAVQEEIAGVIEEAGIPLKDAASDSRTQLITALRALFSVNPFDYIVENQAQFNAMIEWTGANTYQIKEEYKSVLIRPITGGSGYQMSGPNSFLISGETWGKLKTHDCAYLKFEQGAWLDVANTPSHLDISCSDSKTEGVTLKGNGTVASASEYGIVCTGTFCSLYDCWVSTILSNTNISGISGAYLLSGCKVSNISSSGNVRGIDTCYRVSSGWVNDLASTGGTCTGYYGCIATVANSLLFGTINATGEAIGFDTCSYLNGCVGSLASITSSGDVAYGFKNCLYCTNCTAENVTAAHDHAVYGYYECDNLVNCSAKNLDTDGAGTGAGIGFHDCERLSGCSVEDIDAGSGGCRGFDTCSEMSGCTVTDLTAAAGELNGFYLCTIMSSCKVFSISTAVSGQHLVAFNDCDILNSCSVETLSGGDDNCIGFYDCDCLSSCQVKTLASTTGLLYGFMNCANISACIADTIAASGAAAAVAGFAGCEMISSCYSKDISSVGGAIVCGFLNCIYISSCYTAEGSNTGNNYADVSAAEGHIVNKNSVPDMFT